MPPRPAALPDDLELNREGGAMLIGERGVLMHETYGLNPRLFPEGLMEWAQTVPTSRGRPGGEHEMNWVRACKGEAEASCPFTYAGPLTEVMLLGIVALRAGQGRVIEYDGAAGRVTNDAAANDFLRREYRPGFGM